MGHDRTTNVGQLAAAVPRCAPSHEWTGCPHTECALHEPTGLAIHSQARAVDRAGQSTVNSSDTLPHEAPPVAPTGRSASIGSSCVFIDSLLNSPGTRSSPPAQRRRDIPLALGSGGRVEVANATGAVKVWWIPTICRSAVLSGNASS